MPLTEPDLISEVKEMLSIQQIQEYIDSPETSTNPEIRVISKMQKQIYKVMLDSMAMSKRIATLERHNKGE